MILRSKEKLYFKDDKDLEKLYFKDDKDLKKFYFKDDKDLEKNERIEYKAEVQYEEWDK